MFVKNKTLPIYTRIWQEAGLDFLLIPDEDRQKELKTKSTKDASPLNANTFYQNIHNVEQRKEERSIEKSSVKAKEYIPSPRSSQEAKELSENEIILDANGNANPTIPKILKEFEWGEDWESLYKRIARSKNPKVAWTYSGLHADVLKNTYSNATRQEILTDLVRNLDYQKAGINVFVPFDMPTQPSQLLLDKVGNDAVFFWSALFRLKVKVLFVFGEEAREALLLKKSARYTSFMHKAHGIYKVYYLPDLLSLKDKSERNTLLTYLNQQLLSFAI